MIEVPMTDDIRKYQPKVLGPFNLRQICCLVAAIILGWLLWGFIDLEIDDKILIIFAVVLPIMACGWVQMDGLPFEKLVIRMIYFYFLTPKKRKYVTHNTYKEALMKNKNQGTKKKGKKEVVYSNKLKVYY